MRPLIPWVLRPLAVLAIAAMALAWPAMPLLAADPAGQVATVRGEPALHRGSERFAAVAGTPVRVGDLLVTGPRDRLEIHLADASVVVIGPASQVRIDTMALAPDGQRETGILEALSGLLRAVVSPGGDFDVRARATTVSVRSTELAVETGADRVSVLVLAGRVAVADPAIAAGSADLAPGDGIDIATDSATDTATVAGPQRWGPPRVARTMALTTIR